MRGRLRSHGHDVVRVSEILSLNASVELIMSSIFVTAPPPDPAYRSALRSRPASRFARRRYLQTTNNNEHSCPVCGNAQPVLRPMGDEAANSLRRDDGEEQNLGQDAFRQPHPAELSNQLLPLRIPNQRLRLLEIRPRQGLLPKADVHGNNDRRRPAEDEVEAGNR